MHTPSVKRSICLPCMLFSRLFESLARKQIIDTCRFHGTTSLWLANLIGFNEVLKVGGIQKTQVIRQAESRGFAARFARFARARRLKFRQLRRLRSVPSWVAFWLVFTSVSVLNNALFVLLRPHTLPGGIWNYIFKLCKLECEHPQLSDHTSSELYSCVKLVPSIFDIFVFQTTLISKLIQDTMILKTDLRLEKTGKFYVNSEALQKRPY